MNMTTFAKLRKACADLHETDAADGTLDETEDAAKLDEIYGLLAEAIGLQGQKPSVMSVDLDTHEWFTELRITLRVPVQPRSTRERIARARHSR